MATVKIKVLTRRRNEGGISDARVHDTSTLLQGTPTLFYPNPNQVVLVPK